MSERSYSHKSDGRQSSAGQSIHSATSGRANSLTGFGMNTSVEPPGLAPGLFILGSVPAIIRCWLNTNFKHDTLLYAAICTGSYASYLHPELLHRLGFQDQITVNDEGERKIKLSVYLPEAVPLTASSRSSSPAPQLPSLTVDFNVIETKDEQLDSKAIRIFLGSDMLRAHNADVLFSSNQMTLYDESRTKLQIPLVRPEDEHTFRSLFISSKSSIPSQRPLTIDQETSLSSQVGVVSEDSVTSSRNRNPTLTASKGDGATPPTSSEDGSTGRRSLEQLPLLGFTTNASENREEGTEASPASGAPRSGASPAIWSNWRRDTEKSNSMDWANVGKNTSTGQQRRDTGMKVLRPMKTGSRALSSGVPQAPTPATTGQSRFFDDGKRRTSTAGGAETSEPQLRRSVSGEKAKEPPKARSTNPVGGASAFAWLNSGAAK